MNVTSWVVLSFIFFGNVVFAENPCSFMFPHTEGQWGKSALWIEADATVKLYSSPKGKEVGIIKRKAEKSGLLYILSNDSSVNWIEGNHLVWVGHYSISLIRIIGETDGFYKILSETGEDGFWVNSKDLKIEGLQVFSFKELILDEANRLPAKLREGISWAKVGVNLSNSCLNVRDSPSLKGKKINCIPANNYDGDGKTMTHLKIIKTTGNWAYVKVITETHVSPADGPVDCSYEITNEQEGWVKAIGDDGYPNIWFSYTYY